MLVDLYVTFPEQTICCQLVTPHSTIVNEIPIIVQVNLQTEVVILFFICSCAYN